ncbi:MAG: T9SS type A sorting domain-containing protein [Saprospiraceae bacterium]
MNLKLIILALLLSITSSLTAQCTRDQVLADYWINYVGSQVTLTELNWSGAVNDSTCQPGTVSNLAYQRTLQRINYFRRLVGLPDQVEWDETRNVKAQDAALMMLANRDLSHDPPDTWKCWTQDGYDAARKSNLAYGTQSAESIRAYIQDNGANNGAVGHRRWILYSRAKSFGMGSTNSTQALWVIGPANPAPDIDYIAYPAPGFFPKPLVYPRWSFSKPNANFNLANIQMTDANGNDIPLEVLPIANGYGDNTIVWEPEIPFEWISNPFDEPIRVTVTGVLVQGESVDYTYTVQMIPPDGPQLCHPGLSLDDDDCRCHNDLLSSRADANAPIRVFPNPFRETISVTGLPPNTPVDVLDMGGRLMLRRTLVNQTLDLQLLPPGIYFLRIYGQSATTAIKVIKSNH